MQAVNRTVARKAVDAAVEAGKRTVLPTCRSKGVEATDVVAVAVEEGVAVEVEVVVAVAVAVEEEVAVE